MQRLPFSPPQLKLRDIEVKNIIEIPLPLLIFLNILLILILIKWLTIQMYMIYKKIKYGN